MTRLFLFDPSNVFFNVLCNPDGGGSGVRVWTQQPEQQQQDPPDGEEKKFTQAEVDQLIQGRIGNLTKKIEGLDTQLKLKDAENAATKKELDDLNIKLKSPEGDVQGRLAILESTHNKAIEGIQAKLTAAEQTAQKERNDRMALLKSTKLQDALDKAGCRKDAQKLGQNHFANQVVWDDDTNDWMFTLSAGGLVTVEAGVAAELQDFMKDPAIKASGAGGNPQKGGVKAKKLEAEKKKLEELEKRAKASGRDPDIVAAMQQKRLVGQLEAEA